MSRKPIYVYRPHWELACQYLGGQYLIPFDAKQLSGVDNPLVFDVAAHPIPIPDDDCAGLNARGCIWLIYDDGPARKRKHEHFSRRNEQPKEQPKFAGDKVIHGRCMVIDRYGQPWWVDTESRTIRYALAE